MITALEEISRPGPSGKTHIEVKPEDLQTPRAELPNVLGDPIDDEPTPRRRDTSKHSSATGSQTGSSPVLGDELRLVDSRGAETTDDEMDEDAVLLKRPKDE